MTGESQLQPESSPDPTVITTEIILKEIGHLRDLMRAEIAGLDRALTERNNNDIRRFEVIDRRLVEGETRRLEQKADTKRELDAALAAQQASANKSEAMFLGLLAEVKTTFNTALSGQESRIASNGAALTSIQAARTGGREAVSDQRASVAALAGLVGLVLVLLTIAGLVLAFTNGGNP